MEKMTLHNAARVRSVCDIDMRCFDQGIEIGIVIADKDGVSTFSQHVEIIATVPHCDHVLGRMPALAATCIMAAPFPARAGKTSSMRSWLTMILAARPASSSRSRTRRSTLRSSRYTSASSAAVQCVFASIIQPSGAMPCDFFGVPILADGTCIPGVEHRAPLVSASRSRSRHW